MRPSYNIALTNLKQRFNVMFEVNVSNYSVEDMDHSHQE